MLRFHHVQDRNLLLECSIMNFIVLVLEQTECVPTAAPYPKSDVMDQLVKNVLNFHTDLETKLNDKIRTLQNDKKMFLDKINRLNDNEGLMKNEILKLRTELKNERELNAEMKDKLKVERKRVLGWKERAQKDGNIHAKPNHFIFGDKHHEKPDIDLYAPMTEQFSDETNLSVPNYISIGETEKYPTHSDSEEDGMMSPPMLPVKKTVNSVPKFCESEPLIKDSRFETSDDLFSESKPQKAKIKEEFAVPKANFFSSTPNHLKNAGSFKKQLSLKKEPVDTPKGYKYKEVVRGKAEREKLNGYTCEECEHFYANENLSGAQRKEVLDRCSRHRHKSTPPPSTPDEFWEVGFPTTQDYIKKGMLEVDEQCTPREKLISEKRRKRIKYQ